MASEKNPTTNGNNTQESVSSKCASENCANDAQGLRCPTCTKVGKISRFCSKECFQNSWETHKHLHRRPNYLLKIHLLPGEITDPPITRTLSCPANSTFKALHEAIQIAFGWSSTHAYDFVVHDPSYDANQYRDMDLLHFIQRRTSTVLGQPPADPGPRQFLLRLSEPPAPGALAVFGAIDRMHEGYRRHPQTVEKKSRSFKLHMIFDDTQYADKAISYMYDFGDSWDHDIEVIGRPDPTECFVCTDGEGHGCAEDVGNVKGWENLKEAYRTDRPNQDQREKMSWFESMASNRDSAGLRGNKVRSWPKTKINGLLADLVV